MSEHKFLFSYFLEYLILYWMNTRLRGRMFDERVREQSWELADFPELMKNPLLSLFSSITPKDVFERALGQVLPLKLPKHFKLDYSYPYPIPNRVPNPNSGRVKLISKHCQISISFIDTSWWPVTSARTGPAPFSGNLLGIPLSESEQEYVIEHLSELCFITYKDWGEKAPDFSHGDESLSYQALKKKRVDRYTASTMKYKHSQHQVYLLNYHLIWCPKRRKPLLTGNIKIRLEQLLREISEEKGAEILAMDISPDHLHLFVSTYPQLSIHQLVKAYKGRSSRILRREFPQLLKLPSLWKSYKGLLWRRFDKQLSNILSNLPQNLRFPPYAV